VRRSVKIFLSHSAKDRRFVDRLTGVLDDHELSYWYSPRHIVGAQQWHDEIGRALEKCNWFLLVLSPASVKSRWVKHELLFALNQGAYESHIVVLNFRRADFKKLSWTLTQSQWVDFTRDFDRGCRALLRIWRKKHRSTRQDARGRRPR
jgi:hypothetical protein